MVFMRATANKEGATVKILCTQTTLSNLQVTSSTAVMVRTRLCYNADMRTIFGHDSVPGIFNDSNPSSWTFFESSRMDVYLCKGDSQTKSMFWALLVFFSQ
ncbi:hypothetical protein KP509_39G024900 [Ceratopteris richardii]|nr:hypothetical protein KP509_39G024900 [Ceratopteris richardii]